MYNVKPGIFTSIVPSAMAISGNRRAASAAPPLPAPSRDVPPAAAPRDEVRASEKTRRAKRGRKTWEKRWVFNRFLWWKNGV